MAIQDIEDRHDAQLLFERIQAGEKIGLVCKDVNLHREALKRWYNWRCRTARTAKALDDALVQKAKEKLEKQEARQEAKKVSDEKKEAARAVKRRLAKMAPPPDMPPPDLDTPQQLEVYQAKDTLDFSPGAMLAKIDLLTGRLEEIYERYKERHDIGSAELCIKAIDKTATLHARILEAAVKFSAIQKHDPTMSPEWLQLMSVIIQALGDFPEARAAVIQAVDRERAYGSR